MPGSLGGALTVVSAVASTPKEVSAAEGRASLSEVRQLLQTGRLKITDLVDIGEGWTTFDQCPPFDDECEPFRRSARLRTRLMIAAIVSAAIGAVVLLFALQPR